MIASETIGLLVLKFIKFGVVGFFGLAVDFGVTYGLKEKLDINKYVATAIGFILAASSNYMLNRLWTFKSDDPQMALQYIKYGLVSVIGLLLANGVVWMLHERKRLNFYHAKISAIILVMLWNFSANYFFTFR